MLDTNTKSAVSFQAVFFRFDKDQSGDMNLFELRDALKSFGSYVPVASFSQILPLLNIFLLLQFISASLFLALQDINSVILR